MGAAVTDAYPRSNRPYSAADLAAYESEPAARLHGLFWQSLSVRLGRPLYGVRRAFLRRGLTAKVAQPIVTLCDDCGRVLRQSATHRRRRCQRCREAAK